MLKIYYLNIFFCYGKGGRIIKNLENKQHIVFLEYG